MANRNTRKAFNWYSYQLSLLWALLGAGILCHTLTQTDASPAHPTATASAAAASMSQATATAAATAAATEVAAHSPSVATSTTMSPSVSEAIAAVLGNIDSSQIDDKTIILAITNETTTTTTTTTTPAPVKTIVVEEHADGSVVSIVSKRVGAHKHGKSINVTDKLHKFDLFIDPVCEQLSKLSTRQLNKVYQQLKQFSSHTSDHHLAKCFSDHGFKFDLSQVFVMNHDQLAEFCSARASQTESFKLFSTCAARVWSSGIDTELDSILKDRISSGNKGASSAKDQLSSAERSLIDDIVAHLHDEQVQEIASELALEQRQLAEAAAASASTSTSTSSTTTSAPTHKPLLAHQPIGKLNQTQNHTLESLILNSSSAGSVSGAAHQQQQQQIQTTAEQLIVSGSNSSGSQTTSTTAITTNITDFPLASGNPPEMRSLSGADATATAATAAAATTATLATAAASSSQAASHSPAPGQSFATNSDHYLPHTTTTTYDQQHQQQATVWQTTQSPVLIVAHDQAAVQHESNIVSALGHQQQASIISNQQSVDINHNNQQQQQSSILHSSSSELTTNITPIHQTELQHFEQNILTKTSSNHSLAGGLEAATGATQVIGSSVHNLAPSTAAAAAATAHQTDLMPLNQTQGHSSPLPTVLIVATTVAPTQSLAAAVATAAATATASSSGALSPSSSALPGAIAAAAASSGNSITTPAPLVMIKPTISPIADFLLNSINYATSRAPQPILPQPPAQLNPDVAAAAAGATAAAAAAGVSGAPSNSGALVNTGLAGSASAAGASAGNSATSATSSVAASGGGMTANALTPATVGAAGPTLPHDLPNPPHLMVTSAPAAAAQGFIPAPPLASAPLEPKPTVLPIVLPAAAAAGQAVAPPHLGQPAQASGASALAAAGQTSQLAQAKAGVSIEPAALKNIDAALELLSHPNSSSNGTIILAGDHKSGSTTSLIVESSPIAVKSTTPSPIIIIETAAGKTKTIDGVSSIATGAGSAAAAVAAAAATQHSNSMKKDEAHKTLALPIIESVNHTVEIETLGGSGKKKSISHEAKLNEKDKTYVHEVIVVGEHVDGDDLVHDHHDDDDHHNHHSEHSDEHSDGHKSIRHHHYEHEEESETEADEHEEEMSRNKRRRKGYSGSGSGIISKKAIRLEEEIERKRITSHHEQEEEQHERSGGEHESRSSSSRIKGDHSDHEHLLEGLLAGDVIHVDAGELDKSGD